MKTISQALAEFIQLLKTGSPEHGIAPHNAPELLDLWSINMETQVNVAAGAGVAVEGLKGTFCDPNCPDHRWWNIRIPKGAFTTTPTFEDKPLPWPPVLHVNGLGCTGWDWQDRISRWVGFDFDSITGHAAGVGVSDTELDRVREAACALPWVEVRRSTGGKGLHLYVRMLVREIMTHTEHMALGRAILGMMSSEANFDFASQIDACGGNMWIWHQKMTTANAGLSLMKASTQTLGEDDLPTNWRDHVDVVRRRRSKVAVQGLGEEEQDPFEKLVASRPAVPLDDSHKAVIDELRRFSSTEWVADHHCARVHTAALKRLMEDYKGELKLKGIFDTLSAGRDLAQPNAFMFPMLNGAWSVFRFGQGTGEANTWRQDGEGWTTCFFNRDPDLRTAALAFNGKHDGDKNAYFFDSARDAINAVEALGGKVHLPDYMDGQGTYMKVDKSGHISLEVEKHSSRADDMGAWIKKKGHYLYTTTIKPTQESDVTLQSLDKEVRLVCTPEHREAGWLFRTDKDIWVWYTKDNVRTGMRDLADQFGVKKTDLEVLLAKSVRNPWTLVNVPFQAEYPGDRQINYGAPQYRFPPIELGADEEPKHPHWDMILRHCFQEMDGVLRGNEWAERANVLKGADYGLMWIACMLREPFSPLPYLFFYGDQNTGKSILHEAIKLLVTSGVAHADRAFKSGNDFNGELAGAVLATIEETDLSESPAAYNRLKNWVTSPTLAIRKMRMDTYEQPNTLHFIQTANNREACPIFTGDTRIVMLHVPAPEKDIPKSVLMQALEAEAPHFMRTLLDLHLPSPDGRLRIPAIETHSKQRAESAARSLLDEFILDCTEQVAGEKIMFAEFYQQFIDWVPADNKHEWAKRRVSAQLPHQHATCRAGVGKEVKTYVNNIKWKEQSC